LVSVLGLDDDEFRVDDVWFQMDDEWFMGFDDLNGFEGLIVGLWMIWFNFNDFGLFDLMKGL
jgi:hypothetical protein